MSRLGILKRILNQNLFGSTTRNISTSSLKKSAHVPRWSYRRNAYPAPESMQRLADGVGALMWYWILYHCITQYEHLTGEWPYPDPSKWTDQELGIPPEH